TATYTWPGNSIEEVAKVLSRPTSNQRSVGALVADQMGADSFDADHWVMHFAKGHGETNVVPEGLHPAFAELFQRVDQSAGDPLDPGLLASCQRLAGRPIPAGARGDVRRRPAMDLPMPWVRR
ncbi:MAG: hypothetical protein ACR2QO_04435, partial [Acidimicrobiales bacterium]